MYREPSFSTGGRTTCINLTRKLRTIYRYKSIFKKLCKSQWTRKKKEKGCYNSVPTEPQNSRLAFSFDILGKTVVFANPSLLAIASSHTLSSRSRASILAPCQEKGGGGVAPGRPSQLARSGGGTAAARQEGGGAGELHWWPWFSGQRRHPEAGTARERSGDGGHATLKGYGLTITTQHLGGGGRRRCGGSCHCHSGTLTPAQPPHPRAAALAPSPSRASAAPTPSHCRTSSPPPSRAAAPAAAPTRPPLALDLASNRSHVSPRCSHATPCR